MNMDIYSVLTIMLVVCGCSIFLGRAEGYRKGKKVGFKQGVKHGLNMEGGLTYQDTDSMKVSK